MSSLKRKISQLEKNIILENEIISKQSDLLKTSMISPRFILIAGLSAFAVGFIVARKKGLPRLFRVMTGFSLGAYKFYQTARLFLPKK